MNLMRSICCFFSSRCTSEVPEGRKADREAGDTVGGDATAQKSPRRATGETKKSGSKLP